MEKTQIHGSAAKTFLLIRFFEFVVACIALFFLYTTTGQTYWRSGPRNLLQTIQGTVLSAGLYEIGLLYLPIAAVVWILLWNAGLRMALAASVPLLFLVHAALAARLLFFPFSWQLAAAIAAVSLCDAVLAYTMVLNGRPWR